jgi:hypothetical protein
LKNFFNSRTNSTLFLIDTTLTDPTSQAIQKLLLQLVPFL